MQSVAEERVDCHQQASLVARSGGAPSGSPSSQGPPCSVQRHGFFVASARTQARLGRTPLPGSNADLAFDGIGIDDSPERWMADSDPWECTSGAAPRTEVCSSAGMAPSSGRAAVVVTITGVARARQTSPRRVRQDGRPILDPHALATLSRRLRRGTSRQDELRARGQHGPPTAPRTWTLSTSRTPRRSPGRSTHRWLVTCPSRPATRSRCTRPTAGRSAPRGSGRVT
jgi:hypothetical protein